MTLPRRGLLLGAATAALAAPAFAPPLFAPPAFAQGIILGVLIQGIKVENGQFAGGALEWATPFSFWCGI